jgi:hypothetical protein
MPTEPLRVSINERRTYLQIMLPRYTAANRFVQSQLLDEMHMVTGLHRKSLIRLLNAETLERHPRARQRSQTYDHTVDDALRLMAETLDYVCAERLQPALPWLAQTLAKHGELELTPPLLAQLHSISISTVRRRLAHLAQDVPRLPRQRPTRGTRLAQTIPMRRIPWDEPTPGHFETDLVHHCGERASGDYVYTLQKSISSINWGKTLVGNVSATICRGHVPNRPRM